MKQTEKAEPWFTKRFPGAFSPAVYHAALRVKLNCISHNQSHAHAETKNLSYCTQVKSVPNYEADSPFVRY